MAEDENSWVFDSLVCFLNGPIWDAPIQNFIEEKSLIFEPNDEENDGEYRKIFDEYKNLVDFMLGNFMEDIGITPVQFEFACNKGHEHHHAVRFDRNIFEQIWAANNYQMFKRMMTQRNVELQLQALELIERKYGILPQSFIPNKKQAHAVVESKVKEIQDEVKRENIEKAVLTEVAKKFPEEEPFDVPEIQSLMEEKQILENTRDKISSEMVRTEEDLITQELNKEKIEPIVQKENYKAQTISEEKVITQKSEVDKANLAKSLAAVKTETQDIKPSGIKQIDQLELKKRQEYLRMQRDKLVALKKEERLKQFGKSDDSTVKKMRPKSAKAAEAMLTGEKSSIPSQELQLRRALAERLKAEVVDKNKH